MRPLDFTTFLMAVLITCELVLAQRDFGKQAFVQIEKTSVLRSVLSGDANGDGLRDLLLLSNRKKAPGVQEGLRDARLYLRRTRDPVFTSEPDAAFAVPEPVTSVVFADLARESKGDEILFLTGFSTYQWNWSGPGKKIQRLAQVDFLWQFPHPRRVFDWNAGVRDLDRDGRLDLVVPGPDGYQIIRQAAAGTFAVAQHIELPDAILGARKKSAIQRRPGGSVRLVLESNEQRDLVSLRTTLPAPVFADWDGDGDLDLLTQSESQLFLWTQQEGTFQEEPSERFELPVVADRKRRLDVFYSAHVVELNGDGKADSVIFSGDQRSDELRTQVQVFLQGVGRGAQAKTARAPLFGPRGLPQQLLVIQGFLYQPRFEDVDGDGDQDLTLLSMRLDELSAVDGVTSGGEIDIDIYAYLNTGGSFSRSPDLFKRVERKAKTMRGERGEGLLARFVDDVTRDGTRELLVRSAADQLELLWTNRRSGLDFHERALWSMNIDKEADVVVDGSDVLILEKHQLVHVRFKP